MLWLISGRNYPDQRPATSESDSGCWTRPARTRARRKEAGDGDQESRQGREQAGPHRPRQAARPDQEAKGQNISGIRIDCSLSFLIVCTRIYLGLWRFSCSLLLFTILKPHESRNSEVWKAHWKAEIGRWQSDQESSWTQLQNSSVDLLGPIKNGCSMLGKSLINEIIC